MGNSLENIPNISRQLSCMCSLCPNFKKSAKLTVWFKNKQTRLTHKQNLTQKKLLQQNVPLQSLKLTTLFLSEDFQSCTQLLQQSL